jgi:hypothetical protein
LVTNVNLVVTSTSASVSFALVPGVVAYDVLLSEFSSNYSAVVSPTVLPNITIIQVNFTKLVPIHQYVVQVVSHEAVN